MFIQGSANSLVVEQGDILELMAAANFFQVLHIYLLYSLPMFIYPSIYLSISISAYLYNQNLTALIITFCQKTTFFMKHPYIISKQNPIQLEGLLHFCEVRCADLIDLDTIVSYYIHAKVHINTVLANVGTVQYSTPHGKGQYSKM